MRCRGLQTLHVLARAASLANGRDAPGRAGATSRMMTSTPLVSTFPPPHLFRLVCSLLGCNLLEKLQLLVLTTIINDAHVVTNVPIFLESKLAVSVHHNIQFLVRLPDIHRAIIKLERIGMFDSSQDSGDHSLTVEILTREEFCDGVDAA